VLAASDTAASDTAAVRAVVDRAFAELGRIEVVVNAGYGVPRTTTPRGRVAHYSCVRRARSRSSLVAYGSRRRPGTDGVAVSAACSSRSRRCSRASVTFAKDSHSRVLVATERRPDTVSR
jgi:hypothetical protein